MKCLMMGNKSHNIPCRFPNSLKIHNKHPLCHSPCHMGSYSRLPFPPHSSNSRLPMGRHHMMLVPRQGCREWWIRRTSRLRYNERSNLGKCQCFGMLNGTEREKETKLKLHFTSQTSFFSKKNIQNSSK